MKTKYGNNKFERRINYLNHFFNTNLEILEKSNKYFNVKGNLENNDCIFIDTYFQKLNYVKKLDKYVINFDNVSSPISSTPKNEFTFKNEILDTRNYFNQYSKVILKLNKKYIKNINELLEADKGCDDFKIINEIDLQLEKDCNLHLNPQGEDF